MLVIGENSKATIDQFSAEFLREFVTLLKTTHQEKKVQLNHFYQQVISKKDHIHLNATKWSSLTEFCKYLGREGICRVEETEKGLFISWIDNSPETLRRRDAVLKKERQDKGDEEREQKQIQEQVERMRKAELAKAAAAAADKSGSEEDSEKTLLLERKEGDKVKLSFGAKAPSPKNDDQPSEEQKPAKPISFSASTTKPKNIFSSNFAPKTNGTVKTISNPLAAPKKSAFVPQQQKVSQQEMIMKREMEAMERKNNKRVPATTHNVFDGAKRQRVL
jgi:Domain of Kin17 curved DNA-binding protein